MSMLSIVLCIISQMSQETLSDARNLRDALQQKICSIESIECSYTYCCNIRALEQPDQVEIRWKGGLLWYSSRPSILLNHPDAFNVVMESVIGEVISGYWEKSINSDCYYHTNYEKLRFMAYNELSPLTILGVSSPRSYYSFSNTLRELLTTIEKPYVNSTNQHTMLYLFPEPADGDYRKQTTSFGVIVYLDYQGRVEQIDYVLRPRCSLDEVKLLADTEVPINIYRLSSRDIFSNFKEIDGYSIPIQMHRFSFTPNKNDEYSNIVENFQFKVKDGLISPWEYEIKLYSAIHDYSVDEEWKVSIDPDSIRINNPTLSKSDFEIVPLKEPTVTWDIASGDFKDEYGAGNYQEVKEQTEARRIARVQAKMKRNYALPIGVAIGAFSLALLATAIVLKFRGKR